MWAVFMPLFIAVFACTMLMGRYLAHTPLGKVHLWHAPISPLIAGYIGGLAVVYLIRRAATYAVPGYRNGSP